MKCPKCHKEVEKGSLYCPYCLAEIPWVREFSTVETLMKKEQHTNRSFLFLYDKLTCFFKMDVPFISGHTCCYRRIYLLQRMFKIGFNRAARIMDQLCDAGVVGPEEGTKPRKVLMSMEEFQNYLENQ